jgi:CubicO group peptidase (beta-lactamase class C family)
MPRNKPMGNPYGGGGTHFLPRDFIKFGQLMLNEGVWDGKQVLARDFVRPAMTPQYHLRKIHESLDTFGRQHFHSRLHL